MWLEKLSISSVFLPFIVGLIFFKTLTKPQKFFWSFIAFSVLIEIVSSILSYRNINNFFVFKIFLFIDLLFFIMYFKKCQLSYKWINFLGIMVVFLSLILGFLFPILNIAIKFESYFFISIFIYLIIQSGAVNIILFDESEELPFYNYNFWIASARLLYYLFVLFIYVYQSYSEVGFNDKIFNKTFLIINSVANVLLNLMYTKSFLCRKTLH